MIRTESLLVQIFGLQFIMRGCCCTRRVLQSSTFYLRQAPPLPLVETSVLRLSWGRTFSWQGHGTDLLSDSLAHNSGTPKIILHAYGATGIDVVNMIKNKDPGDKELQKSRGFVHMAGSILAFPGACFLWNVRAPKDLSLETLSPVLLHSPKIEYLFLGCAEAIPPATVQKLRGDLAAADVSMVVEPMDVANAIGTFNILNGEDRMVGVALILPEAGQELEKEPNCLRSPVAN